MADTSPGRVQALRAMFAHQDSVMGLLPQANGKIGPRPWKRSMSSLSDDITEQPVQEDRVEQQHVTNLNQNARALLKIIQDQRDLQFEVNDKLNGAMDSCQKTPPHKPVIGPKPLFAKQCSRTTPTPVLNQKQEPSPATGAYKTPKTVPPKPKRNNPPPRKMDETSLSKCIESLVFHHHAYSNGSVVNDRDPASNNKTSDELSVPPRSILNGDTNSNKNQADDGWNSTGLDLSAKIANDAKAISQLSLINSDNYICKSNYKLVRNKLPPKDKLGPSPLKPSKPPHLKIPQSLRSSEIVFSNGFDPTSRTLTCTPNQSVHSGVTTTHTQPKLSSSCPPRPTTAPPVPPFTRPSSTSSHPIQFPVRTAPTAGKSEKSLVEEMEELYEDTLLGRNAERNSMLITDYLGGNCDIEELYDDAVENDEDDVPPPCPPKPRNPPPPPPPSVYLDPIGNPMTEELYQDAAEASDGEFYEEMPSDLIEENHYINNRKELEKLRREKEKRLRKESKEKEKKEKEMEKVKRKFGLLGDEIPIDAGVVKSDSRGGRCDLPVSKGEKVYILRIEGNPAGRWLVRNKKGKYGYVELTNIEVDPDSVKSSSGSSEESLENMSDAQKTETWLSKFTACVR